MHHTLCPCSPLLLWCSGPITPVLPNTETLEEKFLIGTADPTRGSPSASEFHIVQSKDKLCFPAADVDRSLENQEERCLATARRAYWWPNFYCVRPSGVLGFLSVGFQTKVIGQNNTLLFFRTRCATCTTTGLVRSWRKQYSCQTIRRKHPKMNAKMIY